MKGSFLTVVAMHDVEILLAEGYNQFQDLPDFDKVVNGVKSRLVSAD